jgi:hypothetical protein
MYGSKKKKKKEKRIHPSPTDLHKRKKTANNGLHSNTTSVVSNRLSLLFFSFPVGETIINTRSRFML